MPEVASQLEVTPLTPAIGAVVEGVDLREPIDPATARAVRRAVLDHIVVFFRGQDLTREQMSAFMENFGTLVMDPISKYEEPVAPIETLMDMTTNSTKRATSIWHIDSSLAPAPASFLALRPLELPPVGGDTYFGSMYAAYDALSQPMRDMLDGLSAVHSGFQVFTLMDGDYPDLDKSMSSIHPAVRVHPETGRKALFVDELWTERIVELEPAEGRALLAFLFEHVRSECFVTRWRWQFGDIALWDNRCSQHYAVNDYEGKRMLQKSIVAGDRPFGPSSAEADVHRLTA